MNRSLRAKVTLSIIFPLLLILAAFTAVQYSRHRTALLNDLSLLAALSGQIIEADLRHAMIQSDFDEVQAVLDAIGTSPNFRVVYLMDTTGKIIFAPKGQNTGIRLSNTQPDCQPCHSMAPSERPASVIVTDQGGQRVFRSMQPIENSPECAGCHGDQDRLRGLLLTDLYITPLDKTLSTTLKENLIWWFGTIAATVLVVNVVLSRMVLTRLTAFARAFSHIGRGEMPPTLPENLPDEIGQLARAFNYMVEQVQVRESDNRKLSDKLKLENYRRGILLNKLITAQEDERKRVARELHDELGQTLGGLILRTEVAEGYIANSPEKARDSLEEIRMLSQDTMHSMYELIWDLRPSVLDDMGLIVAIRTYLERALKGTGITFSLESEKPSDRYSSAVEISIYRVIQEAVQNVIRHADATNIHVKITHHNNSCEVEVVDDGIGFDPKAVSVNGSAPRGLGLLGIQERVSFLDGIFKIDSAVGRGTRITITIPKMRKTHGQAD